MPYRYGIQKSTGLLLQGLIGSDGPFTVPLAAHAQNIADAHGLPVDDVEIVEAAQPPDLTKAQPPLPLPEPEPLPPVVVPVDASQVDVFVKDVATSPRVLEATVADLLKRVAALESAKPSRV